MKRRIALTAICTVILLLICTTALAAKEERNVQDANGNKIRVQIEYKCGNADGSPHSPRLEITKIETSETSINSVKVQIYFKAVCSENSKHVVDRSTGSPFSLDLKRSLCTERMSDIYGFGMSDSAGSEFVHAFANAEGVAHQWENGKCKNCPAECDHAGNATPPTCTESAPCSLCGKTLDALGHDVRTINRVEPTCTEPGHTAGSYCDRCKEEIVPSTELPPSGHKPVKKRGIEPTCTESGLTDGTYCEVCKTVLTEQQPIPPRPHDYSMRIVEPTCTENGYTLYTCATCRDSYTTRETARLGHRYGLWHENGDATHTAACVRKGCGHSATVACTPLAYLLPEGEATIVFCPVCGARENAEPMTAVRKAQLISEPLPKGEIIVWEAQLSQDERLVIVAFEFAGKPIQPAGRVEVLLPFVPAEGETLTLLNPDGTQAALDYTLRANTTRVTLDYPAQDDAAASLVRVLRLVKNAQ